ncbi:MAG TPA: NUDIX domain-containing protein [Polyangiales bacterium]|nr:NUDIX domain-containing protein [Polyangiales bacterium]
MAAHAKISAGLLMYRRRAGELEVLLAHPGGPIYARKDAGVWTIPKGEPNPGEDLEACARREFSEETGIARDVGALLPLGHVQQKAGKVVHAWAFEGDCDVAELHCNTFELEWPPKSGKKQVFPEVDRFEFFSRKAASEKLNPAQVELVDRLVTALST